MNKINSRYDECVKFDKIIRQQIITSVRYGEFHERCLSS